MMTDLEREARAILRLTIESLYRSDACSSDACSHFSWQVDTARHAAAGLLDVDVALDLSDLTPEVIVANLDRARLIATARKAEEAIQDVDAAIASGEIVDLSDLTPEEIVASLIS